MFYLYISIAVVVGFILLGKIGESLRNKQLEKAFGGRQELSERDFYERYFEARGIPFYVVKELRKILEEVLETDLARLSGEDDFSKNLNFFWQEDSLANIEIIERIEAEFDIKITSSDVDNAESASINGIVNLIWRKIRDKEKFH